MRRKLQISMVVLALVMAIFATGTAQAAPQVYLDKTLPDVQFQEDTALSNAFNLNDYFVLPAGGAYSYSTSSGNLVISVQADGSVDFSAAKNWYGTEQVTFSAQYGQERAFGGILVTVSPVNTPPSLGAEFSTLYMTEDVSLANAFNLNDYFTDVDSDLEFLADAPATLDVDISPEGIVAISPALNWNGEATVVFTAFDGFLDVTATLNVVVAPVDDRPGLASNHPTRVELADSWAHPLELSRFFSDVDGDQLTVTITGSRNLDVHYDRTTGRVVFDNPKDWLGTETVTLVARDPAGGTVSTTVQVVASESSAQTAANMGILSVSSVASLLAALLFVASRRKRLLESSRARSPLDLEGNRFYRK